MRSIIAGVILLWLSVSAAVAGPWMRKAGTGFASVTLRAARAGDGLMSGPVSGYRSVYMEYGLRQRMTAGLDLGRSVSGADKAVGFVRWQGPQFGGTVSAYELGLGVIDGRHVLRPGLSWGTGWQRGDRSGWIAADLVAEIPLGGPGADLKIDLTGGVNRPDGGHLMLQLQAGQRRGDRPFLRIEPSATFRVGARGHAEIGLSLGIAGDDTVGLKVGFWHRF